MKLLSDQSDLLKMAFDHLIVLVLWDSLLARKDIYFSDQ